jgi:hypothetical protein
VDISSSRYGEYLKKYKEEDCDENNYIIFLPALMYMYLQYSMCRYFKAIDLCWIVNNTFGEHISLRWNVEYIFLSFDTCKIKQERQSYPCNRPWRPIVLWDVQAPTFSLDNRLTDGGKIVSLMRRLSFTTQEDSWYSFLLETDSTPRAKMRLEGVGKLKKKFHLIRTRTRDLPVCTLVPQPTSFKTQNKD